MALQHFARIGAIKLTFKNV